TTRACACLPGRKWLLHLSSIVQDVATHEFAYIQVYSCVASNMSTFVFGDASNIPRLRQFTARMWRKEYLNYRLVRGRSIRYWASTQQQRGVDVMWKAVLPGAIALVTLGLSLVSGEVVKRESDGRQVLALAQTGAPDQAETRTTATADVRQAAAETGRPIALVIRHAAYPHTGLPL